MVFDQMNSHSLKDKLWLKNNFVRCINKNDDDDDDCDDDNNDIRNECLYK